MPFRRDVAENQPPDELAYQIVSMVQYARDRMPDNPPLLVADFLSAQSIADHIAALDKFFSVIPELANLTQKQLAIKGVLMQMFGGSQASPPEEAGVEEPTIIMDEDQVVEDQDAADTIIRGEAHTADGAEIQDRGDYAPDTTELEDEAVPGPVG